jgi:thiol-disulfide isomerase/thioredoxin
MIKRLALALAALVLGLGAGGYALYAANSAPVVAAIALNDPAVAGRPYVVKLHAKWCSSCMLTKGVWGEVQAAYAGKVNLLVFDLTNEATTAASRAEAKRLGLEAFFDANHGSTGYVAVIDPKTKAVVSEISSRDLADYRAAIDPAIAAAAKK